MKTIDQRQNVGTNLEASSQLKQLSIENFDYSKPVSLIKYLIRLNEKKENMKSWGLTNSGNKIVDDNFESKNL